MKKLKNEGIIGFELIGYQEALKLCTLKGNRSVSQNHVKDFISILKKTKFDENNKIAFRTSLIIVNERNLHIIDGQHRYAAFIKAVEDGIIPKDTCIIVATIDCKTIEEEFEVVKAHNEKTKNWTLKDYMNAYAVQKEDYKELDNFCKKHELCLTKSGKPQYSYALAILGKDRTSAKFGGLQVSEDDLALANNIHGELLAIHHRFGISCDYTIIPMVKMWRKYRSKFSMQDIRRYELPSSILSMPRKTGRNWEAIFASMRQYYENKHSA